MLTSEEISPQCRGAPDAGEASAAPAVVSPGAVLVVAPLLGDLQELLSQKGLYTYRSADGRVDEENKVVTQELRILCSPRACR